jgi:hypothetical protein
MASFSSDDGGRRPTLGLRLSQAFRRPAMPLNGASGQQPDQPADDVLSPADRRAAMNGLDPTELKWSRAGIALAALIGLILVVYLAVDHPTRKVTQKIHGVSHVRLVPVSDTYLLIGAIVLGFCLLGYEGLRRRKRTLVAFALFVDGFAFTLVFAPLGFALIVLGGWLMLRAYRIQKFGSANAKMAARQAAARPPRRQRKQAAGTPAKPSGYKPPTANKRYTPKAAPRKKVAKPVE